VCGGLAEYFGMDPTIVRIITAVIAIPGPGLIMYLLAALVMPEDNGTTYQGEQWNNSSHTSGDSQWNQNTGADFGADTNTNRYTSSTSGLGSDFDVGSDEWREDPKYESKDKNKILLGLILVCLGIVFFVKQLFPMFNIKYLVPVALIIIGVGIITRGRGK
jgi:phage shock protein C